MLHVVDEDGWDLQPVVGVGNGNLGLSIPVVDVVEHITVQSILVFDDGAGLYLRDGNLGYHIVLVDTFGEEPLFTDLGLHHLAVLQVVGRSLKVLDVLLGVFLILIIDVLDA